MVMRIAKLVTPTGKAGASQGSVSNQGITYNQTGLTFNEGTVTYGGFYGFAQGDIIPMISKYSDIYTTQGTSPLVGSSGMLEGILGLTYP